MGVAPGLCGSCRHAERITARASLYYYCGRSRDEPARFPRYPRLPVVACPGFLPGGAPAGAPGP